MLNKFKTEFPAIACNEGFARMIASGFIMDLDPTCEELSEIKTAVSEAVTNAIIHGYGDEKGIVTLEGYMEGNKICFKVSDRGKGIENIELARQPLYTGAPEQERSGMGFTIMEAFMDEIDIVSSRGEGTTVTLIKTLKTEGEDNEN